MDLHLSDLYELTKDEFSEKTKGVNTQRLVQLLQEQDNHLSQLLNLFVNGGKTVSEFHFERRRAKLVKVRLAEEISRRRSNTNQTKLF